MKVLITSDLHGLPVAEKNLMKFLERGYDCLILAGDLTNFGPISTAENLFEKIKSIGIPTLAVPGNCDPKPILKVLDKYNVNLHGKCRKIYDIELAGFGGSNLTPFHTPFELSEEEIKEGLSKLPCAESDKLVLVTHTPPFNTKVDLTFQNLHAGSKSIREFTEKRQPALLVCGHVHEARDIDSIGRTIVVNAGPLSRGHAAEAIIDEKISVRLIELSEP
jgi:Icc-related predicted phosphoesterase